MRGILRSTFGAIYEKVYQPYHDKGLDDYLLGASPWLTEEIVHLERRPTFLKPAFWGFRNMWASIILGGGVLGFGYYAYIALFETPGSDWIAVASYAVSAVFFLQGLLMVIVSDTYNL